MLKMDRQFLSPGMVDMLTRQQAQEQRAISDAEQQRQLQLQMLKAQLDQAMAARAGGGGGAQGGGAVYMGNDMVQPPGQQQGGMSSWTNDPREIKARQQADAMDAMRMQAAQQEMSARQRQLEIYRSFLEDALAASKQGGPDVRRNYNIG